MMKPNSYMFFLLLGLLLVAQDPTGSPSAQVILRVPQDYPTIQAAVDAAPEGATILIAPGIYVESITITKDLTLEGSGMEKTILQPPMPPSIPGQLLPENPMITVQTRGRAITLYVRKLTVRSNPGSLQQSITSDIGLKVQAGTSLVFEDSAWVGLLGVVQGTSLQRLEIYDSLFQNNFLIFGSTNQSPTAISQIAIIKDSRFDNNLGAIFLQGKQLIAYHNVILCDPASPQQQGGGISFTLAVEDGRSEVIGNLVSLCNRGIALFQTVKKARVVVKNNRLLANRDNSIEFSTFTASRAQLSILIEKNSVIGGNVGVMIEIGPSIEGGMVQLLQNHIAWQRKGYLGDTPAGGVLGWGSGVLLDTSLRQEVLKEPLQIEISENRIEGNEAWGLALNLLPGEDDRPDQCNLKAPGEEQVFVDPEISGSGNVFRDNGKGDLCPPDYPWPPGFRK
jgi:hypothetical protein